MSSDAQAVLFPCDNCGAPELSWDAASHQLVCPFCDATFDVERDASPKLEGRLSAQCERPLSEGLSLREGEGLGVASRSVECQQCGASVAFIGVEIASRCDFCGSDQVLEQASSTKVFRPQGLVPFLVPDDRAKAMFDKWLKSLWFRPNALKKESRVTELRGVYVPYWTFDAHVSSQWTADAGHFYYVTETYTAYVDGKPQTRTRQVQKVRWVPARGQRQDVYDDVLVVASKGLPQKMAARLQTFKTTELVDYQPDYLAGWCAEEYAVLLPDAWVEGKKHIDASQRMRCSRDVPGDTQRFLRVHSSYSGETFKHILLPIWISAYRFRDKPYRFLVNGQTGEVTGDAPYSWIKITLFVLMLLAIAAVIWFFASGGRL